MIWSEKNYVSPHDLDVNNIASASAILRYLQEAAYGQMYNNPPSLDDLRTQGKTFLLSRLRLDIYSELHVYDELTVQSWSCDGGSVSYPRCGRVLRGNETVAEIRSLWALVDIENRKLLKISEYPQSYTNEPPLDGANDRLRLPRELEMSLVGEHAVIYEDIDVNEHINNTHYPDILCGCLPTMKNKRVTRIMINYVHEAPLGAKLKIYSAQSESGSIAFRTILEDGRTNVEAEMTVTDI